VVINNNTNQYSTFVSQNGVGIGQSLNRAFRTVDGVLPSDNNFAAGIGRITIHSGTGAQDGSAAIVFDVPDANEGVRRGSNDPGPGEPIPQGFTDIVIAGPGLFSWEQGNGADIVDISIGYSPAAMPDANGIITFPFYITPTLYNSASTSMTRIFLTPVGYRPGAGNIWDVPQQRSRSPLQLVLMHQQRTLVAVHPGGNNSNSPSSPNILAGQWEEGTTYKLIITIDTNASATTDFTYTVEAFRVDGETLTPFNNSNEAGWKDRYRMRAAMRVGQSPTATAISATALTA
jgi:hypothetical protein